MTGGLSFRVYHPRHEPVGTSQRTLRGRPTCIATWESPWKTVVGEATPLSGFGVDDVAAAESALSTATVSSLLESSNRVVKLYEQGKALLAEDGRWSEPLAVASASARFCLEILALRAAAAVCRVPLWRLLTESPVAPNLEQTAVLDPISDTGWEHFNREVRRGVRVFKVKCGRQSATESRYVRGLLERSGDVSLRFDANSAWTLAQAEDFLRPWPSRRIEWVEDPTSDPSEWSRLRESTGVSVALDEPLSARPHVSVAEEGGAFDVLVLKPMVLGGFSACLELARVARRAGQHVVISHLFDGPVALDACIDLAFAIQSPDFAPGLGEHAALSGYARAGLGETTRLEGARMISEPAHSSPRAANSAGT